MRAVRISRLILLTLSAAPLSVFAQPLRVIPAGNATIGYLGIGYRDVTAESAKELHLPEEAGAEVRSIAPDSPAVAAGIRVGDVVVQYNGQRVEGWVQLTRLISETPPGREVRIVVYRNGYPQSLVAKIGSPPPRPAVLAGPFLPMPGTGMDIPSSRMSFRSGIGAEWEALDGQLAMYFGAREGGVLVRSVTSGSAADRAGLRAGDVIVRVGDTRVTMPTDISARMRAERAASSSITVIRDHREVGLTVMLDGGRGGQ